MKLSQLMPCFVSAVISTLAVVHPLTSTSYAAELDQINLKNQDNKPITLKDFDGRYVLLSFVYASCPMPEMCPLTMNINKKIMKEWQNDGQPFPFHIVFATLDPEEDGPGEMKQYGENNKLDTKNFTLITGTESSIADLTSYFDSAPIPGEAMINHKIVSVLLGPNLTVLKKFTGNKYEYNQIKKLAASTPSTSLDGQQATQPPKKPDALRTSASAESEKFQNQLPEANNTTPNIIDLSERKTLMGINPKQYDKFWEKWRLVNVRYRTSPAEQRFVYANDIAWRTLKAGKTKFEEGAVFGKVAYTVGFDPRFPSSYQPTKFSRIQFMKKDSNRYKSTDGWGYALYLNAPDEKSTFGESEVQACHACHRLAANHDFVFDTPVFVSSNSFVASGRDFFENFIRTPIRDLPEAIASIVKTENKTGTSDVLDYKISAFQGTISESMLPVARLATERNLPVLLRADDNAGFVLAFKIKKNEMNCNNTAKVFVKDMQIISGQPVSGLAREMTFCDGVFK